MATQESRNRLSFDSDAEVVFRLRIGGMTALAIQLLLITADFRGESPRNLFGFHLFDLAVVVMGLGLTWTGWFARHWRIALLMICVMLVGSGTIIGVMSRSVFPHPVGLGLFALLLAAFLPWGILYQVGANLSFLGSFAITAPYAPAHDPYQALFTIVFLAALIIAQFAAWFAERYRTNLELSQARIRSIVENALDAVVTLEDRGVVTGWNRQAQELFGYASEEVVGRPVAEVILPPSARAAFLSNLEDFRKSGKLRLLDRVTELNLARRDGREFPAEIALSDARVGEQRYLTGFIRDITELKKAQQAVIDAALETARAKSDFLSHMSHEIRTPMNAILGVADLLWESRLSPEQREYVRIFRSNGAILLNLIDGILDLSRVEAGRLSLEEIDFDLCELVDKAVETMAVAAHDKGLALNCRIRPEVPVDLIGDPLRLRQVLVNVLGNAVKFTERGHVLIDVENDPELGRPGALRFSVADTGIGIPPAQQEQIFSAFTQVDASTTRRHGGSGLGLAIARELVTLMGGKLWVESQVGAGSTFRFTVRMRSQPQRGGKLFDAGALSGRSVLVVDQDPLCRLVVSEVLSARGARVSEAGGGKEARARLLSARQAGHPFDLLLLDSQAERGEGGAAQPQLLADEPGLAQQTVLMVNANQLTAEVARANALGVERYLVKPIKRADLLEAAALALAAGRQAPATVAPAAADGAPTEEGPAETALRILLVDDSPDNRLLVRAYLKQTPHRLEVAENGAVAIEKFTAGKYDLVLMDMQMPVMDGYTAVEKLRQWERGHHAARTPVIALTAYVLQEDVDKSLKAGCDGHITKPLSKATLLKTIAGAARTAGDNAALQVAAEPGDARDLISGFLEAKGREAAQISAALERDDYETVGLLGHRMRGEGGALGFPEISEIGASLESAARMADREAIRSRVEALSKYLAQLARQ